MPVPVFVDQIFGGHFAQRAEPLRAIRAHPDEVAGRDGIPVVVQPVDAAALAASAARAPSRESPPWAESRRAGRSWCSRRNRRRNRRAAACGLPALHRRPERCGATVCSSPVKASGAAVIQRRAQAFRSPRRGRPIRDRIAPPRSGRQIRVLRQCVSTCAVHRDRPFEHIQERLRRAGLHHARRLRTPPCIP